MESPGAWVRGTVDSHPSGTIGASCQSDLQFVPWHWPDHRSCGKSEKQKEVIIILQ